MGRAASGSLILLAVASLTLASCQSSKPVVVKPAHCGLTSKFKSDWAAAQAQVKAQVKKDHPIVDVHTHAFNARYLPIKHVIAARKWGAGIWFLPSAWLEAAAVTITGGTPKTECAAADRAERMRQWEKTHGPIGNDDSKRLTAMIATNKSQPHLAWTVSPRQKEEELASKPSPSSTSPPAINDRGTGDDIGPAGWVAYHMGVKWVVTRLVGSLFGHGAEATPDKENIARSAVSLMSSEKENWERMQHFFPQVDLFVYQNMDLVPSFYPKGRKGTYAYSYSDNHVGKDSVDSALPRIQTMCKESQGKMIYFVAWNPFRTVAKNAYLASENEAERNRGRTMVDSLKLVQDAITKGGASGVKFYPPLGYRPHCNDFSQIPKPWGQEARLQWKDRYGHTAAEHGTAADLDALNEELFAWCESNNVPIFTHCNTGEFRAYDEPVYAEMANPKYWIPVLQKHHNLRLCFGHAGGVSDWYGGCESGPKKVEDEKKWGGIVRKLCLKYENVYCEFGIHDDVAKDPAMAQQLYQNLGILLPEKCRGKWTLDAKYKKLPTLGDKVMYGSDYFMPVAVSPQDYLLSFETLFSMEKLRGYKPQFFSGNAMKYLKR